MKGKIPEGRDIILDPVAHMKQKPKFNTKF